MVHFYLKSDAGTNMAAFKIYGKDFPYRPKPPLASVTIDLFNQFRGGVAHGNRKADLFGQTDIQNFVTETPPGRALI